MQHLDDGSLQAWMDRTRSGLESADVDAVERHLEGCERCTQRAKELAALTGRTGALLSAGGDADVPDYRTVVLRARALRSRGRRSGGWSAAAWAASVAVALGAGWLGNDAYRASRARPAGDALERLCDC